MGWTSDSELFHSPVFGRLELSESLWSVPHLSPAEAPKPCHWRPVSGRQDSGLEDDKDSDEAGDGVLKGWDGLHQKTL